MATTPTVQDVVYQYLNDTLQNVTPEPHLTLVEDLGFDSLDIIEMTIFIEDKLDIRIDDDSIVLKSNTVGELISHIKGGYNLD